MKASYIISIAFVLISCNSLQKKKAPEILCFDKHFHQKAENVSLRDVEGMKKLTGKFVQVEGIFRYSFEDVALYPSKFSDLSQAIWIELTIPDTIPDSLIGTFDGKRVIIIGKLNLNKKGHMNGYMAALDSAFCIKKI